MGWKTFLVEMQEVIIAGLATLVLLAYRKHIAGFVRRMTKFEKTDDGYRFEAAGEGSPEDIEDEDEDVTPTDREITEDEVREDETEDVGPGNELLDAWLMEDTDVAIQRLQEIAEQTDDQEKQVMAQTFVGNLFAKEDFQKGVQHLLDIAEEFPESWRPYHWLANEYLGNELYSQALEAIENAIERAPEIVRPHETKARILRKSGRPDQAIGYLQELLEDGRLAADFFILVTRYLEESDEPTVARNFYLEGLQAFPDSERLMRKYANFLTEHDMNEEAVLRFQQLQRLDPDDSAYPTLLGNVYLELDMHGKALEAYEEGNRLANGEEAWIHGNIGNLYLSKGLYSPAIEELRKALEIDPESDYAHNRMSRAQKAREQAQERVDEIIESARAEIGKVVEGSASE